jgi:hypothetical protein
MNVISSINNFNISKTFPLPLRASHLLNTHRPRTSHITPYFRLHTKMCRHHRSRYGYGYGQHGYGYNYPHHRGPISALVALAVPLLTQNSTEKQTLAQEPYQPTATREYLAPQTSGRIMAPTEPEVPRDPAANEPLDPPPAYEDSNPSPSAEPLEKSLSNLHISSAPTSPATAIGARDYKPMARQISSSTTASPCQARTNPPPASLPPMDPLSSILDPSSRWAAKLHRKEDKQRAKLARKADKVHAKLERKADKFARRERRDIERAY